MRVSFGWLTFFQAAPLLTLDLLPVVSVSQFSSLSGLRMVLLYFVSDRSGWWNLYRLNRESVEVVYEKQAEFGVPHWVFGLSTYAFTQQNRLSAPMASEGSQRWHTIDTRTLNLQKIDTAYTDISYVRATSGKAVFRAGSPTEPPSIVKLDLQTGKIRRLPPFQQSKDRRRLHFYPAADRVSYRKRINRSRILLRPSK